MLCLSGFEATVNITLDYHESDRTIKMINYFLLALPH